MWILHDWMTLFQNLSFSRRLSKTYVIDRPIHRFIIDKRKEISGFSKTSNYQRIVTEIICLLAISFFIRAVVVWHLTLNLSPFFLIFFNLSRYFPSNYALILHPPFLASLINDRLSLWLAQGQLWCGVKKIQDPP